MIPSTDIEDVPVGATRTTFRIIEYLLENDGGGVTEIADELSLTKSSVHDHVNTLRQFGYVVKDDNIYYLSLRFYKIGRYTRTRKEFYENIETEIEKIADKTDQRVQFIVREGRMAIPVAFASGDNSLPYIGYDLGQPGHLHATASGKSILAHLSEDQREAILDGELPALTENTITDPDLLREELQLVRDRGYAMNMEESFEGLRAVGSPVLDRDGSVLGSISVSGPATRFHGDMFTEEIPNILRDKIDELKLVFEHM